MMCQLEFSRLCYLFILEFRPMVLDYLEEHFHSMEPIEAFESLLNDGALKKWYCRQTYDRAVGEEVIDFSSIGCLFANSNFLKQPQFAMHEEEIKGLYRSLHMVRNENAHLSPLLTEKDVESAILNLLRFADYFGIHLNRFEKRKQAKNDDAYCLLSFSKVTVFVSLFIEDFREFYLDFCSQLGINYKNEVLDYYKDRCVMCYVNDVCEVIDMDFIRVLIKKHFDAVVEYCSGYADRDEAEGVLCYFHELSANRNNVAHETFADLDGTINFLKDFYRIFGWNFDSLQCRVDWFVNRSKN